MPRKRVSKKDLFILTDKQELARRMLIDENIYTEILFDGGSRAGKSVVILICIIMLCLEFQGLRALISRMRFAHARASLWEQTLVPLIQKLKIPHRIDGSMFIIKIGKSQIWLGGLDSKERAEKILGTEYGLIFLNECTEIPESTRDIVKTRLAQNIKGFNNFMIYDCNPRQPYHYLFQEFYVNKTEDKGVLKFLPEDNIEHLPKGYIENILDKLPPDKKARFRKGEWVYLEGAVYHNIKEENKVNCEKNIYKFYDEVVVGIDWGLHMCATIWGIKKAEPKIEAYCIHEIIILNGTTQDLINELDKVFGIKQQNCILHCDHEPDRIMELQNAGYSAIKAYKEVGAGDSSVNEYELYFDNNCKYTFQSMANLVNQENPAGKGFLYGKHVKENDHECLIGETLILTDNGNKKIENINIGDRVLTRKGFKRIYAKKMNGSKPVYEYNINGNKITCTDNHKFYCGNNKYKEIQYLTYNDTLCILNIRGIIKCQILRKIQKLLFSKILNLEGIQAQKKEVIGFITSQIQIILKKELDFYIEKYGKRNMGISQKVMLSIIKMGTLSIMKYQILNALKKENTLVSILENGYKITQNLIKKILKKQEKKLKNGIEVRKVLNGIKNKLKNLILVKNRLRKNVDSAIKNFMASMFPSFALIVVNQKIEENQELIILQRNVLNAKQNLEVINMRKKSSVQKNVVPYIYGEPKGKQKVYSISVEDNPEYFANNILVRNSDGSRYALHGWRMDNNIQSGGHHILGKSII